MNECIVYHWYCYAFCTTINCSTRSAGISLQCLVYRSGIKCNNNNNNTRYNNILSSKKKKIRLPTTGYSLITTTQYMIDIRISEEGEQNKTYQIKSVCQSNALALFILAAAAAAAAAAALWIATDEDRPSFS